jgi:hypothetical protein
MKINIKIVTYYQTSLMSILWYLGLSFEYILKSEKI